jgi:hypothetical protein
MAEDDRKIAEAEIKLEKNDFAGAVKDYRSIAVQMPSKIDMVLGNLSVAEIQERLAFAREMSKLYPNSIVVGFREAQLLLESGFALQAIKRFSDLITLSKEEMLQEKRARLGRLEAALRADAYRVFIEDFLWLWKSATLPLQKQHLLRFLARGEKVDFVSVLKQLLEKEIFPPEIENFVRAKSDELELFNNALEHLDKDEQ